LTEKSVHGAVYTFPIYLSGSLLNAENEKDAKYRKLKAVLDLKFPDVKVSKQQP
jgi:hypothetical protein